MSVSQCCFAPLHAQPCAGDEVTTLLFGRGGVLYTGHISGMVRRWEVPLGESSSSEEEEDEAPQAVELAAAGAAQQQQR